MYVCCECGTEFDEPITYKENHGECFGFPAIETVYGSPCCFADYEEKEGNDE